MYLLGSWGFCAFDDEFTLSLLPVRSCNQGRVKITANGIDVAECGEGGHFGEIGILRNAPRITTCTAMTDCEVFILTKQAFDDVSSRAFLLEWFSCSFLVCITSE